MKSNNVFNRKKGSFHCPFVKYKNMKNTEIKQACHLACNELDAFISLTKLLLEKSSSTASETTLNNYITRIYEASNSMALPLLISLFEQYSNDYNATIVVICQAAINQLNIFYNQVLPLHISELSKLSDKKRIPRELLTGFIYSIEVIKKNLTNAIDNLNSV